jgi:succinyl-CoA synthetase beta subunit
MQLYEFQAKKIFQQNGILIPKGEMARTPQDAAKAAMALGGALAIKAQVLVGGRGLAGGIKFAERPEQVEKMATQVLGASVKGERPRAVLVEEKLQASRELYCGITYDFINRSPAVIASSRGGVDIETVAREHPQDITRKLIDPLRGYSPYIGREMAAKIGLQGSHALQYANITTALWRIFEHYDAELVETNPLAIVDDQLMALDAKLSIDDKSIQRHQDLMKEIQSLPPDQSDDYALRRLQARELRIPTYIEMQGNIGIIADGAGTGMLTLDLVADSGGKVGAYCEMGGETTAELMENTMKAILSVSSMSVVLVNLIGGLNRMDEMAKGIASYLRKNPTQVPVVVRMSGTMEEEGRRILNSEGILAHDNLYEAVEEAVHLSR